MRIILKNGDRETFALIAVVVLAMGTAGCTSAASSVSASGQVRVVAAENFWGSIASQIGGAGADVTSVISNPDTDPHDYEPTAADARSVARAGVVIENGIGYDPWMSQLLGADPSAGRVVLDVGKLLKVPDGGNPHQWYSRASVERFVEQITDDLAAVDHGHRADYIRNERAFESSGLAEYDALIAQIKRQYAGTPIGASESIVTPLAETLGLRMMTPGSFLDAVAEGNEPTAADKATADSEIERHQIKVFVFNSQNSTPDVQRLVDDARREHIPVVAVTETLTPAHATFQEWQVRELRALLGALVQAGAK